MTDRHAVTESSPSHPEHAAFDADQRAFIEHRHRLVAIISPPGTGKTTSQAARFAHLVKNGVDPDRILVMTFTNKARESFEDKLRPRLPEGIAARIIQPTENLPALRPIDAPHPLHIGTFHRSCARILSAHLIDHRPAAAYRVIDPLNVRERVRVALDMAGLLQGSDKAIENTVNDTVNLLSLHKRLGIDVRRYQAGRDSVPPVRTIAMPSEEVAELLAEVQTRLYDERVLEPDDLPLLTYRLLQSSAEHRAAWSRRYDHVMVDEYQDTDPLVTRIIAILGAHATIDICGDDSQSIYGWRDAIGSFRELKVLEATHGKPVVIPLRTDYRLSRQLQGAAESIRTQISATTALEPLPSYRDGEAPRHHEAPTDGGMYDAIVGDILHRVEKDGNRFHDCALLTRTNGEAAAVANQLGVRGLPVWLASTTAANRLTEALRAWLTLAVSEPTDAAVQLAFKGLPYQIGAASFSALRRTARPLGRTLLEQMRAERHASDAYGAVLTTYDRIKAEVDLGPVDAVNPSATIRRVLSYLQLEQASDQTGTAQHAAYQQLVEFILGVGERVLSVDDVVRSLAAGGHNLETAPPEHVQVRTMHSAKGLEFAHVYAVHWAEEAFPPWWADDMAEERRIAYVAITRASKSFSSWSSAEDRWGNQARVSRFVHDAGMDVVKLDQRKAA